MNKLLILLAIILCSCGKTPMPANQSAGQEASFSVSDSESIPVMPTEVYTPPTASPQQP